MIPTPRCLQSEALVAPVVVAVVPEARVARVEKNPALVEAVVRLVRLPARKTVLVPVVLVALVDLAVLEDLADLRSLSPPIKSH